MPEHKIKIATFLCCSVAGSAEQLFYSVIDHLSPVTLNIYNNCFT